MDVATPSQGPRGFTGATGATGAQGILLPPNTFIVLKIYLHFHNVCI